MREYVLTPAEARLAFAQVAHHCASLKNWIASAVERGDLPAAQKMVAELRTHQQLYAKLNVEAHELIDAAGAEAEARRRLEVA